MIYLITGASGFIGSHLVAHLRQLSSKHVVHTLDRKPSSAPSERSHAADLLDTEKLTALVGKIQPDRVFHLAGFSRVSGKDGVPENFELNYLGTDSLLKALAKIPKPVSVFLASSTAVYGNQAQKVSEDSPVQPGSAYGFSKFLAEEAARKATENSPSLSVVVGRLYNSIGPGQAAGFVVPDLCARIRDALKKEGAALQTGPLDGRRSFMDVRDTVKILAGLLDRPQKSRFEIFNLASPHTHTIREIVNTLVELSGKPLEVRPSNAIAPNAFAGLEVGTEKLSKVLHPSFRPLKETLKDTLENELKKDTVS